MTWEQFKKIVEAMMEAQGIPLDVQIQFIVVGDLYTDCISVKFEQGLSISNEEEDHVSATTEAVGTMTWGQFKGLVEEKIKKQDISSTSRVWFIDMLSPHADDVDRVSVEFDRAGGGLWISNI